MHAFLLIAGQPSIAAAESRVRRAAERALRVIPDIAADPQTRVVGLEGFDGALALVAPREDYTPAFVQVDDAGELAALCYGTIGGTSRTAERVVETFRAGGARAVQRLDGSFAAVLLNRRLRCLWLLSDSIGMRAATFVLGDGTLCIASHELLHVAAGQASGDLDLDSIASLVACDWSLGGRSLVRGVVRHPPWQVLEWSKEGTRFEDDRLIDPGRRLRPDDEQAIELQLDRVVDGLLGATRHFVAGKSSVRASLTAGLDSRGVLALLVGAGARGLELFTNGSASSLDVRVAARLAKLVGAKHTSSLPGEPSAGAFEAHNRLRAFALDGSADARRAMASLPRWNPGRTIVAGGVGGEIFRGFFYPYFATGQVPASVEQLMATLLKWRFRRLATLPFADPAVRDRLRDRLGSRLTELARFGEGGHDTLDLFYLYDRYALWGAASERGTWSQRFTPYEAKGAIALAYQLPPPVGSRCTVMPRAIRRFLPARAYFAPVNGTSLLALEGPGRLRTVLRQALSAQGKLVAELERKFKGRETHQDVRSRWIVNEYSRELLSSPQSLANDLFGAAGVERMISEQTRASKHSVTLAYLLTAEEFRRLSVELRGLS